MRTGLVWLAIWLITAGCGDDDGADDGLGAAGVGVGVVDGGGGAGTTAGDPAGAGSSGSAGTRGSQSGASGRSGSAGGAGGKGASGDGASGGAAAGSGGMGSANAGTQSDPIPPACDLQCEPGERCMLVEVQCFRAPCPAQPMCVPEASGGRACGSRGHAPCPDGQYCQFAPGSNCGAADQGGRCVERRTICTREYRPVCGCDGETYGNACEAGAAGVSVASEGECGGRAAADCDRRKVACDAPEPACAEGTTASVSGACYGPCVSIERCACSAPEECPDADHYTCHRSAGRCGPYV